MFGAEKGPKINFGLNILRTRCEHLTLIVIPGIRFRSIAPKAESLLTYIYVSNSIFSVDGFFHVRSENPTIHRQATLTIQFHNSKATSTMASNDSIDFETNGLEQIQYKTTTTTSKDGITETKVLTIFFDEEMKDQVPTKSMLDESWHLVKDTTADDNDVNDDSCEINHSSTRTLKMAKLAFQSPIPTRTKLSISSSKMAKSKLLVAKSA